MKKFETFFLSVVLHLVIVLVISAVISFVATVFSVVVNPEDCLLISMATVLFVLYPTVFTLVTDVGKKDK